ncbi:MULTISPECIES: hypothetical protein [unclassified Mesorhizobium]|uniref:hypothetical protein n=1 Tax=unclassified Mesorhizobium TaxID=325217 RepID=UPI0003F80015|nr:MULTISPECIES: hypothetical protein [unclassified Mesorhizobium]
MKVYITGTPLEALLWKRAIRKVRVVFRPGTDPDTERAFLLDLKQAIEEKLNDETRTGSPRPSP